MPFVFVFSVLLFYLSGFSWTTLLLLGLSLLPGVHATTTDHTPFPNITFQHFSYFVLGHFSPHISLATVLLLLFSLTENPELLNLHARQAHPAYHNEKKIQASSWLKCLSRAMRHNWELKWNNSFRPSNICLELQLVILH